MDRIVSEFEPLRGWGADALVVALDRHPGIA
jgi:hypothetical protein